MTSDRMEEAIEYLHSILSEDDCDDPDKIVDAMGIVLMAYPTNVRKETVRKFLAALRIDLKEGREGEEWKHAD